MGVEPTQQRESAHDADGAAQKSGRAAFATERLDYDLPPELIAQVPTVRRGESRMLVCSRGGGAIKDQHIGDLPQHLSAGDALVVNNVRVIPARFMLRRDTGGLIEGLFLAETEAGVWDVMLKGGRRIREGERLTIADETIDTAVVAQENLGRGRWRLQLPDEVFAVELLNRVGRMPLPPYIRRDSTVDDRDAIDRERYQTVYASGAGAVAAPTAGLHLTESLLQDLRDGGVQIATVTLHVGYGTFAPLEADDLAEHRMHSEYFELAGEALDRLRSVRDAGRRIIAVGTTSVRVLETVWDRDASSTTLTGWTDLFCYPPYEFRSADMLLTNFHLPRSTLLALVMAFAGEQTIRQVYDHAIRERYRFYSYGDACLFL